MLSSTLTPPSSNVPCAPRTPTSQNAPQVCWEKHWGSDASAITLNIYKCTLASCVFIAAVGVYAAVIGGPFLSAAMPGAFSPLLLSSIIGIVVGDVMWLKALQVRYTAVAIQLWLYGCGYTAVACCTVPHYTLWLVICHLDTHSSRTRLDTSTRDTSTRDIISPLPAAGDAPTGGD